jgi:hypothetical protein
MKAMTQIFEQKTPFLTARVMDILFDGVGIDCNTNHFEASSLCSTLENNRAIKVVNDTFLKFSVFGGVSLHRSVCQPQCHII